MTDMPGAEKRKIDRQTRYHTETPQLAEGCHHIAVTGGLNCIFCSLYYLYNHVPCTYHAGAVASWHRPAQGLIDILCGATSWGNLVVVSAYRARHARS
jgi:hypothetical protein